MTSQDHIKKTTSYDLFHMVANYKRSGGKLDPVDEQLYEAVGNSHIDDESYKEALVDLVERLEDSGLVN